MRDPQSSPFAKVHVLDARSKPEYDMGCINGARNVQTVSEAMWLFDLPNPQNDAIVIHCERSSQRGPQLAMQIRDIDRMRRGFNQFPALSFPQTYLLEGGYREFYRRYPMLCRGGYLKWKNVPRSGMLGRSSSQETPFLRPRPVRTPAFLGIQDSIEYRFSTVADMKGFAPDHVL
jgi:M-phase inducer tyrosine phosphatase